MLGFSLRDQIRNEEIRRQLKSPTLPVELPTFSGSRLGIFTCIQKGCRGQRVLPCTGRRIVGRPPTRWSDDVVRVARNHWMQAAQDRLLWEALRDAYFQQWTSFR